MIKVKDKIITFKVTAEELKMVKRGAEKEGFTMSDYCRACVIRDRLMDLDPVAVKIMKENVGTFMKTTEEAIEAAVERMLAPIKEMKMKLAGGTKGGRFG